MIKPNLFNLPARISCEHREVNRLLSAAVISSRFCSTLLNDPIAAASKGYEGEQFKLDHSEKEKISVIRAGSLKEFAAQLSAR